MGRSPAGACRADPAPFPFTPEEALMSDLGPETGLERFAHIEDSGKLLDCWYSAPLGVLATLLLLVGMFGEWDRTASLWAAGAVGTFVFFTMEALASPFRPMLKAYPIRGILLIGVCSVVCSGVYIALKKFGL
jgi:hypothetical protein